MKAKELELDNFIEETIGASVSFHSVTWNRGRTPALIPSGGNINYHSLPMSGTAPHSHEFAEIILVLNGKIYHRANGERQLLTQDSLVFVRPTDIHGFEPAEESPCEMIFLAFQLELFLTLSRYLEEDTFLQKFTASVLPPTFLLDGHEANELSTRMLSINTAGLTPSARKIKIKILLADLFTQYFLDENYTLTEQRVPDWLDELCQKMRSPENFIKGLKRMQKLACCTPEHLCKSFRRYLDKSPTEFINELRINYAARLLADSNEEIGAISYDLNFQSLSRFYHLFKKYYGVSPAKYRIKAKTAKKII
jgi:AraC family cel operon transcriptional repressor